jgi:PAS domain S-box-containing protein
MRIEDARARTADGMCAVDPNGLITDWNEAAERVLGYGAAEVVGRPCCEVFGGRDDRGNLFCYPNCQVLTLAGMAESVHNFDLETRHRRGRRVRLNVSIVVLEGSRPRGPGRRTVHLFREIEVDRNAGGPDRASTSASHSHGPNDLPTLLTRREAQILGLLANGVDTQAIAGRLHISRATVRNHTQNILGKIGAHNRLEAAAWAHRHGLVPPVDRAVSADRRPAAVPVARRHRRHG